MIIIAQVFYVSNSKMSHNAKLGIFTKIINKYTVGLFSRNIILVKIALVFSGNK